jgi:hypothetical protein
LVFVDDQVDSITPFHHKLVAEAYSWLTLGRAKLGYGWCRGICVTPSSARKQPFSPTMPHALPHTTVANDEPHA